MRMWNVNPKIMCNKHLLGEHVEMHMFAGSLAKGKSIEGYVTRGLVQTGDIAKRHNEVADEMTRRKMLHRSPLEQPDVTPRGNVDPSISLSDLFERCDDCARRMEQ